MRQQQPCNKECVPLQRKKQTIMLKKYFLASLALPLLLTACKSHYQLAGVERTRILVDKRYDAHPDKQATAFLAPYKGRVDSIMSPVVGRVDHYMAAHRPESDESNLLADILVWGGQAFGEKPDFGVYNMGGIRAAFAEGDVTYGDVLDVAPFENHICFLTLTGEKTLQLFSEMARVGGEGVSHGVKMVITADRKLRSVTLHGKPIEPNATYRIATLDYLAQGNDHLDAFKAKTNEVSPQGEENDVRHIIVNYFKQQAAEGKAVSAQVEGRITYEK